MKFKVVVGEGVADRRGKRKTTETIAVGGEGVAESEDSMEEFLERKEH